MDKYAKLTEALIDALEYGAEVEKCNPEGGGTCNFDSLCLTLPHWCGKKIEQAARDAGSRAFKWNFCGVHWIFRPYTHGQGNARTRNAEAVADRMRDLGYDAGVYYAMD